MFVIVRRAVLNQTLATIAGQREQLKADTTERIAAINAARETRAQADKAERQLRKAREDGIALEATNDQLSAQLIAAQRELAAERAAREEAQKAAAVAQNNFEWARLTLNTAEQRCAELMAHVLRAQTSTALQIERATPPPTTRADARDVIGMGLPTNSDVSFEDIGDAEAAAAGIGWDGEGQVMYGNDHGNQRTHG